jgi:glycerol-3-phosphate acyltransferase PlsY
MGFIGLLVIAFLIGGIPFGLIVGYLTGHSDIRRQGSGNIGATNVWRIAGPAAAVFAFIGDIGKGILAVFLTRWLYDPSWPVGLSTAALAAGVAAILGHVFSPYLGFRGGKGVNTALGVFLSLMPLEVIAGFVTFLVIVVLFRYISLGSMAGAIAFVATVWVGRFGLHRPIDNLYLAVASFVGLLILFTHRQNIKRLLDGTESRFRWRKMTA